MHTSALTVGHVVYVQYAILAKETEMKYTQWT